MTVSPTSPRSDQKSLGIALIILGTLLTAIQDTTIKYTSSDLTVWQLFTIRSALLIPIFLVIGHISGGFKSSWQAALQPWLMIRSLVFVAMYLCMYSVLPFISLSTMGAGLYTAPLFVAAMSPVILGEPVKLRGILAILVGFVGVLIMLRPGTDAFSWLTLIPVLGGFFYALAGVITRAKCQDTTASAFAISLAIALFTTGALASLLIFMIQPTQSTVATAPFLLEQWTAFGSYEWMIIAVLTALMMGISTVIPSAYQKAPTVIIATFDYCFLVWATVLGYFVFSDIPDLPTILGMVLIVCAGLIITPS